MPSTLMKQHIAQVLKDEGFILDYQVGAFVANEQGRNVFQTPVDAAVPKKVLPFTGSDDGLLALLAMGIALMGAGFVLAGRRQAQL